MELRFASPLRALAAAALAALGLAATATAASQLASPPQSGIWAGKVTQELGLPDPYVTKITITAYKGRIVGLAARIRMQCDDDSVTDAFVSKSWRIGTGPKMTQAGSFSLVTGAVALQGNLGRVLAEGVVKARTRDCSGEGFWKARKRSI